MWLEESSRTRIWAPISHFPSSIFALMLIVRIRVPCPPYQPQPASASALGFSSSSFKFAFIGRSSRRILIRGTLTQRRRQHWSVDDERRLSLSTLWGGHENVLIIAEFYNYCSKVNYCITNRQSSYCRCHCPRSHQHERPQFRP